MFFNNIKECAPKSFISEEGKENRTEVVKLIKKKINVWCEKNLGNDSPLGQSTYKNLTYIQCSENLGIPKKKYRTQLYTEIR